MAHISLEKPVLNQSIKEYGIQFPNHIPLTVYPGRNTNTQAWTELRGLIERGEILHGFGATLATGGSVGICAGIGGVVVGGAALSAALPIIGVAAAVTAVGTGISVLSERCLMTWKDFHAKAEERVTKEEFAVYERISRRGIGANGRSLAGRFISWWKK